MLWLCIHLPRLAAEVVARAGAVREPFAVVEGEGTRQVVAAASREAEGAGLFAGMALSAACALAPGLSVVRRDERSEAEALSRLAAWAGRFTPVVCLAPPRELLLEVEGSVRLFGGLGNLARQVEEGVRGLGYAARIALAGTPLAATLLARAGTGARAAGARDLESALRGVPVECLDLSPETLSALESLGVRRFGELSKLPRAGLARRFGKELVLYLDRALGRAPDPRERFEPPPRFEGRLELFAGTFSADVLLFAGRRLLLEMAGYLEARGCGVCGFRLILFHEGGRNTPVEVGLIAPARDPGRLCGLLREKLARTRIPEPVSAVELLAERFVPVAPSNLGLREGPGGEREAPQEWSALVERLRARLGADAVCGLRPAAEHRPERAFSTVEPSPEEAGGTPARFGERPLWLLPRPLPLARDDVTLLAGPERIESGWWDGGDVSRDYFVAGDPSGARLWIFRERDGGRRWYLHGIFA